MIENYSPSMDAHAKDDGGTLRKGVPWQTMVNCDGSYTLVRVFLSGGGATCTMLCSCQEIPLAVLARFCVRVCRLANQENLLSPSGREPDAAQGAARDADSSLDLDDRGWDGAPADLRGGGAAADGTAAVGRGGLAPGAHVLGQQGRHA